MSQKPCIYVEETDSPIGMLTVACVKDGLCKVAFGTLKETTSSIQLWAKNNMLHNQLKQDADITRGVVDQLNEYFAGTRQAFDIKLCLKGTPFQRKVWYALTEIGYGETKTYKEIAMTIGNPKAVRAVGSANNKNPVPIIIPCHRVIGSSGALVGYGGGIDKKERLLQLEKVI